MKLVSYTLMTCTLNEVLRKLTSQSHHPQATPPLAPSLGKRTSLRSKRLELVGARKNEARVSPSRATKEGFTKFRAVLTRKRDCAQLQKFGEREQASTRLNFASKSSKGKILRSVKNFKGPFITPFTGSTALTHTNCARNKAQTLELTK